MSVVLESTRNCSGLPVVRLGLVSVGVDFTHTVRDDGHFLSTYGQPGPLLRDGDALHVGIRACLAWLRARAGASDDATVARWNRLATEEAGPAAGALRQGASGDDAIRARATLGAVLRELDQQLEATPFLLGADPSPADWPFVALPVEGPMAAMLPPRVRDYGLRLRALATPR